MKPGTSDGWLSVDEIKSFVFSELPRQLESGTTLSPLEIEHAKIQVVSQTVANIPLVKNPAYSPQSQAFCQRIKQVLEWDDLKIQPLREIDSSSPSKTPPANFFTFEKNEFGKLINIGVIPYYNAVMHLTEEELLELANWARDSIDQDEFDRIWLVTEQRLANTLCRKFERTVGQRTLTWVITAAELEENFNPFKNEYLDRLWKVYAEPNPNNPHEPPLQKTYVDIQAEERVYGLEKGLARGFKEKNAAKEDGQPVYWRSEPLKLETFMRDWLQKETESAMVIVADYGAGKTTFCDYFAAILAQERRQSYEHNKSRYRIPLVIPLRYFADVSKPKLTSHLAAFFNDYSSPYSVRNVSPHALAKLAENGRLLFLLDGFDEMATQADQNKIITNFNLFRELISKGQNKVIITTRPEYFESLSHRLELIGDYPTIYIRLFEPAQIISYLEKKTGAGEATYKRIEGIYDLSDLASRPILLKMIAETINQFEEGKTITRPMLYEKYLLDEHKRQLEIKDRKDVKISSGTRLKIAEWLAWEMYRTENENTGLPDTVLKDICAENKLFSSENTYEQIRELTEIRTCTYLVESIEGHRFSHKSIFEYLLARRLYQQITTRSQRGLALHRLNLNTIEFLAEFAPDLSIIKSWLLESLPPLEDKEISNLHRNCSELLLVCRLTNLRQQTRLSTAKTKTYLDLELITNAEYMVFIQEEMENSKLGYEYYYQPDRWQHLRYLAEQAFEPVKGLTLDDARNFLSFLSRRYSNRHYTFKLPTTVPTGEKLSSTTGYWLVNPYRLHGLAASTTNELTKQLQEFVKSDYASNPSVVQPPILSLDLSLVLSHTLDRTNVNDLSRSFDRSLAVDHAISRAVDHAISRARDFDRDLTRLLDRTFARSLLRALTFTESKLLRLLGAGQFLEVAELAKELSTKTSSEEKKRSLILLQDLMGISLQENWRTRRQIAYHYNLHFAEFVCYGYQSLINQEKDTSQKERYQRSYELWQQAYWWHKVAQARSQRLLPAYEGVRLLCVYNDGQTTQ